MRSNEAEKSEENSIAEIWIFTSEAVIELFKWSEYNLLLEI